MKYGFFFRRLPIFPAGDEFYFILCGYFCRCKDVISF